MGFDIDLDDFNSDLSEEEMMRKMFEMLGDAKEQSEARAAEPKRKKTKKQIEKEEREKQIEEAKKQKYRRCLQKSGKGFSPGFRARRRTPSRKRSVNETTDRRLQKQ